MTQFDYWCISWQQQITLSESQFAAKLLMGLGNQATIKVTSTIRRGFMECYFVPDTKYQFWVACMILVKEKSNKVKDCLHIIGFTNIIMDCTESEYCRGKITSMAEKTFKAKLYILMCQYRWWNEKNVVNIPLWKLLVAFRPRKGTVGPDWRLEECNYQFILRVWKHPQGIPPPPFRLGASSLVAKDHVVNL